MKRIFHKTSAVWVSAALCLAMLSVTPLTASENDPTVKVSDTEIAVQEDGSFSFTIELGSATPYLGTDVYVRCEEGVTLTNATVDVGSASVSQPTAATAESIKGLVGFGFFVSGNAIDHSTFTITGTCDADDSRTITIVRADVYAEVDQDYQTLTNESGTVITLNKQPSVPVTTTTVPVTTTTAPVTTTTAPITTTTAPVTTTTAPVTTTITPEHPSESPDVPQTGDMNVPVLQICCAVIAVIAASTLIYITHKHKIRKGE